VQENNHLGSMLKRLLKDQSLSMRKLSALTDIDTATMSRIVNGKRKATPEHLRKSADSLNVSMTELFATAGFPIINHSSDKKAVFLFLLSPTKTSLKHPVLRMLKSN
jgi:transcriptional regulator with XRE-family HTH domain